MGDQRKGEENQPENQKNIEILDKGNEEKGNKQICTTESNPLFKGIGTGRGRMHSWAGVIDAQSIETLTNGKKVLFRERRDPKAKTNYKKGRKTNNKNMPKSSTKNKKLNTSKSKLC